MKTDKFLEKLIRERDEYDKTLHSVPSYPSSDSLGHLAYLNELIRDYREFINEKDSH